jgi:hypothetical protein
MHFYGIRPLMHPRPSGLAQRTDVVWHEMFDMGYGRTTQWAQSAARWNRRRRDGNRM